MNFIYDNKEVSDHINSLPDELLIDIFKWLPVESLIICENVCNRWNELAQDPALWKRIVLVYSGKSGENSRSEKNLAIITTHSAYISCIKVQYVYNYSEIISVIEQCKNLTSLELIMCRIGKEFEDDILKWPKLKKISLKNSILFVGNPGLLIQFNKLTELNYLALSDFGLNSKNCYGLLQCSHLSYIAIDKIKDLKLDFIKLLVISSQRLLHTLHIYGGRSIDDSVLQLLSQCSRLKNLAIIRCDFLSDVGLTFLTSLKKMEHLQIWNNDNFSEIGLLKTLGSSALINLQTLSLSRIKNVTPVIVDLISECYKKLKYLALYQCPRIINTDYERQLKSKFRNIDVVLF